MECVACVFLILCRLSSEHDSYLLGELLLGLANGIKREVSRLVPRSWYSLLQAKMLEGSVDLGCIRISYPKP